MIIGILVAGQEVAVSSTVGLVCGRLRSLEGCVRCLRLAERSRVEFHKANFGMEQTLSLLI